MNISLLKEVLSAERLRFRSISRKTGLTPDRLAELAEGADPTVKEWRLVSRALNLNSSSAAQYKQRDSKYGFLFRSPMGGNKLNQALLAKLSNKMSLSDELRPGGSTAKIASIKKHFVQHESYLDAEANARLFRKLFVDGDELRPLTDLPDIISSKLGVRIFLIETAGIEGASVVSEQDAFIFLAVRFQPRMLFTLAHELAHVLFHQNDETEFVTIDFNSKKSRPEIISTNASQQERYAHSFASALLMPDVAVGRLLQRLRAHSQSRGDLGDVEINFIARFFGVSFLAAAARCESLKLLPVGGAISLDEWVKKNSGSAEKRASELGLPERMPLIFKYFPEELLSAAIQKIRDGSLSIGRASSELGITVEDLISANEQRVH